MKRELISVTHNQDHAGDRVIAHFGNTVIDIADNTETGGMTIEVYAYDRRRGRLMTAIAGQGEMEGTQVIEVFTGEPDAE